MASAEGDDRTHATVSKARSEPVTVSPLAACKLPDSGQSEPSPDWPAGSPWLQCKPELRALLRSCAHKSATAQLSLSALCEAAEEAVVFSAAGCTDVTLTIC
jgi:hypothetical protein